MITKLSDNTGLYQRNSPGIKYSVNQYPLISVIVLTYRNFLHLYDTLKTIFNQDYPNIELIISDDASEIFPHGSILDYINKHKSCSIKRIEILCNEKNMGIVAHSNRVAKYFCKGEYIKFLPSGDGFCRYNSLSMLLRLFNQNDTEIVTTPSLVYQDDFRNIRYQFPSPRQVKKLKKNTSNKFFKQLSFSNIISAVGTMYHYSFFLSGGLDETYYHLDDWPNWLQIALDGKIIPCGEIPTVFYELGGISTVFLSNSNITSRQLMKDLRLCIEKEILPQKKRLSFFTKIFLNYRYKQLSGETGIWFRIKYFPFAIFFSIWSRKVKINILSHLHKKRQREKDNESILVGV